MEETQNNGNSTKDEIKQEIAVLWKDKAVGIDQIVVELYLFDLSMK